jgi:hypothetical protein
MTNAPNAALQAYWERRKRLGGSPPRPSVVPISRVRPKAPKQKPEPVIDERAMARKIEFEMMIARAKAKYDDENAARASEAKRHFSDIVDRTCTKYGVTKHDIMAFRRAACLTVPRHEIMWLARQLKMSYPLIGKRMNGRDHTTVMHGIKQHQRRLDQGFFDPVSGLPLSPEGRLALIRRVVLSVDGGPMQDVIAANESYRGNSSVQASTA